MHEGINWADIIEAAKAQNSAGIQMRGSKRYTPVSVRMEIARRYLGATVGVSTEIVTWGQQKGDPVVVKATITSALDGMVLATGHAEEIRGQGNVNSTSALENAETSAIGRALAALGLSGGEFASSNELDAVERKKAAQKPAEPPHDPLTGEIEMPPSAPAEGSHGASIRDAWEDGIRDSLPQDHTERDFFIAGCKSLKAQFSGYKDPKWLLAAWTKYGGFLSRLHAFDATLFATLEAHYQECEKALAEKPASPKLTKAAGEAILLGISKCDLLAELEQYMAALRRGPNAYAADHPKIIAAYEEQKAAIVEANPAEARSPLDYFTQG